MPTLLIAILGLVALLVVAVGAVVTRYKVAGPNEAFIITGKGGDPTDPANQQVVLGGGVFVMPVVKQLHVMDLSSKRIPVTVKKAMTKQGIRLNLEAVAIVKVGGNEESVRAAAQRFLTQQHEIEVFANDVLTGALRSIVGELPVEQITNERTQFAAAARSDVEETITAQGLTLDSFEIQDVTDDGTYLADLARPEAAEKRQMAEIAEAEATRISEEAKVRAAEQVAVANRTLALKQAEIKAETDKAAADAAAAGPLAEAARQQEILAQEEQVAVKRAALTERDLETTVRKPADAERYRVEQAAEAARTAEIASADARKAAKIADAEAEARQAELLGNAEKARRTALAEASAIEGAKAGEAERSRRAAIAEAVRLEGESEAAAIAAKGAAEAEAMQKKADAYAEYTDAAVLEMITEMLPKVAHEVAAPMGSIDKLTVISTDGAGQLPKQVTANLTQVLQMVSDATGVNVNDLVANASSKMLGAGKAPVNGDTAETSNA